MKQHALARLIEQLQSLPGIGEKTANRLAMHILRAPPEQAADLARTIEEARTKIGLCKRCQDFTEGELCNICRDPHRDPAKLMIVDAPSGFQAMEGTGHYHGYYYILHGSLSPLNAVGPEELRLDKLKKLIRNTEDIKEVILALNSDPEGEATTLYLMEYLAELSPEVTRLATGVPVGTHIAYTDPVTLSRALASRQQS